jgi:hypothetical protein
MKKLILLITVIAFLLSSCEIASFDDDINKNPNLPSQAEASQLIANAMLSLPALSSSPQGEYNAQYLSEVIYIDDSLYPEATTSFYWLYQGPLMNLQTAIENTNDANEAAVAKILKAYYFWHMTDRWGDIPYSEALNGTEDFTPAYDTQEAIYDSLFVILKEARDQLEVGAGLSNDIIYDGNIEKWRKFGNTIRMLMALRLSEVDAQKAETEFTTAVDDGVMTSNNDSFVFQHLANENNENYWFNQIIRQSRVWWAIPVRIINMMEPNNDPRISVYAEHAANTRDYTGLTFGTPNDVDADDYSLLGTQIYEQDAPVYLVTYAQAKFALAEAAQRGWTTDAAASHYNEAIEASIKQWTGSDAGVQSYLSEPDVAYNPASVEEGIELISEQRYLHLFMHGYEAWAEYRRTGYPDNMVNPQGRDVPLRQAYTSDEELNNTENYQEAVNRQFNGQNSIYGRLWWDVE